MADILAIGEALVELNQPRDGAPFTLGFGGDTSNAMIAAARCGASAAPAMTPAAARRKRRIARLERSISRARLAASA